MSSKETLAIPTPILPSQNSDAITSYARDSMLVQLKHETSEYHRKLETESGIWAMLSSYTRYRHLISRMFGIYSTLESRLQRVPGLARHLPDVSARWKMPMLEADLAALGVNAKSCLAIRETLDFAHVAAAFGCFYVLEGSTLGGQLISRQVHAQLGLTPEHGCQFFSSYGANIGQMWMRFGQSLEFFAMSNDAHRRDIVVGALNTFEFMSYWLTGKEAPV